MTNDKTIRVGVGAVVFKGDDVLLIRRGKAPFKDCWSIPGGKLEYGERVVDAVRREVREETGIEIDLIGLLDVFDGVPETQPGFSQHLVMIDYVAHWKGGAVRAGDDASEAEFVDMETALARLSWDETRRAIERAMEFHKTFKKSPLSGNITP